MADGCEDDTVKRLRAARYPYPLQVREQSPGRGAASARNLGGGVARGGFDSDGDRAHPGP